MPPPLLQCHKLTLHCGTRTLIDGLDWSIEAGSRWGLLGPNGSGKSTLLRALAGLQPVTAGEVHLLGKSYRHWKAKESARIRAYLPQDDQSELPSRVYEKVLSGRYPHLSWPGIAGATDHAIVEAAIEALDLGAVRDLATPQLSGGEQRRAALAAILAQQARILLLDEPLNHLDLKHQAGLLRTLTQALQENTGSAVVSLHDINLAAGFCTHLMLLNGKGGATRGPAADMLEPKRLSQLYEHPVQLFDTPAGPRFMLG